MADLGLKLTDKELEKLERELAREYARARREMQAKLEKQLKNFNALDAQKLKLVEKNKMSLTEYEKWRKDQLLKSSWMRKMIKSYSEDQVAINKKAADIINRTLPKVYAENHNFATFEVESLANIDTSYTLLNKDVVARLVAEKTDLLPTAKIDEAKDRRWNQSLFRSEITQSVLQGESNAKRAQRLLDAGMKVSADSIKGAKDMSPEQLAKELERRNREVAIRNARTMTTNAQNAGKLDGYFRAREMGIPIKKMWQATLDDRTRSSHRHLDGEVQELEDTFSNGLQYPADPDGVGAEVYNCRCNLSMQIRGFERNISDLSGRGTDHLAQKSYDEWKKGHSDRSASGGLKGTKSRSAQKASAFELAPNELAGFKRGEPMNHRDADSGRINPAYKTDKDIKRIYSENCQSCVVAYEARRRGYNVEALGREYLVDRNGKIYYPITSVQEKLASDRTLAWIDTLTGMHPVVEASHCKSHSGMLKYLESNIKSDERYFFAYHWKNKIDEGNHIIVAFRNEKDKIVLYDPQSDREFPDTMWVDAYLKHFKVKYKDGKRDVSPVLMRVDNLAFDEDVLRGVVTAADG